MSNCCWTNGFFPWIILVLIGIIQLSFIFCLALNHEGIALLKFRDRVVNDPFGALSSWSEENGEANPCSWFGIGCSGGHVISLDLKNFCLEGTLAPELHHLLHIKSIILRNNSFFGTIPEELKNLKRLELLDLGYNNFCKSTPQESVVDIPILLLDNNGLSCHIFPQLEEHVTLSEVREAENQLNSLKVLPYARHDDHAQDVRHRRKLQNSDIITHSSSAQSSTPNVGNTQGDAVSPSFGKFEPPPQTPPPRPVTPPRPPLFPTGPLTPSPPNVTTPPTPIQPPPANSSLPPPSPPVTPPSSPSSPGGPPTLSSNPNATIPPIIQPPPANGFLPPPSPSPVSGTRTKTIPIVVGAVGGFIGLVLVSLLLYFLRGHRIRKATGLSGQLQKAFVAGGDRSDGLNSDKPSFIEGMSNLRRSELVSACEDFSNVIGSSSIGTIYKGTLSNGVEVAVISLAVTSAKDWSRNLEAQFRKKIEVLSKVNHKNLVNLIAYCEEEEPFTRLMVFEYAPNGSLFEHLHVREAEHLDWGMRLRVAMGMAYCLEHMHQLTPPVTHPNLNSSAVNLSEDYAAKISDFCFWNEVAAPRVQPISNGINNLSTSSVNLESNVYSFGLVLLEMMTGRIPQSLENNSLDDWVLEYMRGERPLQELVDPILRRFNNEQLGTISEVIRKCLHSEQNRPTMKEVTARLNEITGINQDKAVPRFSSLWWAELESRSVNGT